MFSKRVIYTVITAFVLSVVIGSGINKISDDDLNKQLFVYKIYDPQTYDVLIAGDSRAYRGVSPKEFENELGLRTFNIGFSAVTYDPYLFDLIEEKLDKKAKHPTIILAVTPHSLTNYSFSNGHIREIKAMKTEEIMLYKSFLPFASVFNPFSFSELLKAFSGSLTQDQLFDQKHFMKQGWIYSDFNVKQPQYALKSYHATFKNRRIDTTITSNFYHQIEVWINKGYDVYGFIPPSSPNIETLERSYSGFTDKEVAREFMAHKGKWIHLDSVYESYDGSHLAGESAIRLSKELARKINKGEVDSVFDENKNYRISYLPLEPPKFQNLYHFNSSEYSYKSEEGQLIGKIDPHHIFINYAAVDMDTILKKRISKIISRGQFLIPEGNLAFNIVFEVNRGGKVLIYKKLSSKWILKQGVWGEVTFELNITEDIQKGDLIKCYIYNHQKAVFYIKDLRTLYY